MCVFFLISQTSTSYKRFSKLTWHSHSWRLHIHNLSLLFLSSRCKKKNPCWCVLYTTIGGTFCHLKTIHVTPQKLSIAFLDDYICVSSSELWCVSIILFFSFQILFILFSLPYFGYCVSLLLLFGPSSLCLVKFSFIITIISSIKLRFI